MYPQRDARLAIVDIDASKGLVILWLHVFIATEGTHRNGKGVFFGFDLIQTCLIFPLQWACFPIKFSRNAQWEHLFPMDFDDFSTIYLSF